MNYLSQFNDYLHYKFYETEKEGIIMNVLQIGIIGVAGTILALQFKSGKSEYGIYISIALSIIVFVGILGEMATLIETMRRIGSYINVDAVYISTLLKMLGITYVSEFSSSICKDAGYQTIAGQIEIFGKLAVFVLSMPVLLALLDTVRGFLS